MALLQLGWSYRRIQSETGVHRETVSRYDHLRRPKPTTVFPGSDSVNEQNQFLRRWNRTIARLRIHGTTRKQVWSHFLETDKPSALARRDPGLLSRSGPRC